MKRALAAFLVAALALVAAHFSAAGSARRGGAVAAVGAAASEAEAQKLQSVRYRLTVQFTGTYKKQVTHPQLGTVTDFVRGVTVWKAQSRPFRLFKTGTPKKPRYRLSPPGSDSSLSLMAPASHKATGTLDLAGTIVVAGATKVKDCVSPYTGTLAGGASTEAEIDLFPSSGRYIGRLQIWMKPSSGAVVKYKQAQVTCIVSTPGGEVSVQLGGGTFFCADCLAIPRLPYELPLERSEVRFGRQFRLKLHLDAVVEPSLSRITPLGEESWTYDWVFMFKPLRKR